MYDADGLMDEFDDTLAQDEEEIVLEDDEVIDLDDVEIDECLLADEDDDDASVLEEELLKLEVGETWSDDPVRMYLTQMGEIPLLTRQREIALARQIETSRRKFRAKLLECDYVLQHAVRTLKRVHHNELPFDRTVQVSVTDSLEKVQIMGRFPLNLASLERMVRRNRRDYRVATGKSRAPEERRMAWSRLGRSRRRAVRLIEELGLRTQRIETMITTLPKYERFAA